MVELEERLGGVEIPSKPCTYWVMSKDSTSTTFQSVEKGSRLYECTQCKGTPGSCPNYSDYYKLMEHSSEI